MKYEGTCYNCIKRAIDDDDKSFCVLHNKSIGAQDTQCKFFDNQSNYLPRTVYFLSEWDRKLLKNRARKSWKQDKDFYKMLD